MSRIFGWDPKVFYKMHMWFYIWLRTDHMGQLFSLLLPFTCLYNWAYLFYLYLFYTYQLSHVFWSVQAVIGNYNYLRSSLRMIITRNISSIISIISQCMFNYCDTSNKKKIMIYGGEGWNKVLMVLQLHLCIHRKIVNAAWVPMLTCVVNYSKRWFVWCISFKTLYNLIYVPHLHWFAKREEENSTCCCIWLPTIQLS